MSSPTVIGGKKTKKVMNPTVTKAREVLKKCSSACRATYMTTLKEYARTETMNKKDEAKKKREEAKKKREEAMKKRDEAMKKNRAVAATTTSNQAKTKPPSSGPSSPACVQKVHSRCRRFSNPVSREQCRKVLTGRYKECK